MDTTALEEILSAAGGLSIAVVGDYCLDVYYTLDQTKSEISVETGLRTRAVRDIQVHPGGAGNVLENLRALGAGRLLPVGAIGGDHHGTSLIERFSSRCGGGTDSEIDTSGLIRQNGEWHTAVYTKIIDSGKELERIDFGNFNCISPETIKSLGVSLRKLVPACQALIINQQLRGGIHVGEVRELLGELASANPGIPFILDSRDHPDEYGPVIRKLNRQEAYAIIGASPEASAEYGRDGELWKDADPQDLAVLSALHERWGRPVIMTLGGGGSIFHDGERIAFEPAVSHSSKLDPVGAGDSFLAGFGLALAAKRGFAEAVEFGTLVAGVTVAKINQTGTASPEELRRLNRELNRRMHPRLARESGLARHVTGSEIELVTRLPARRGFTHAIFDHDGTVSTLRQGWERIMEPMMVQAIIGDRSDRMKEGDLERVESEVRTMIDLTTGARTITQMSRLAEMVKAAGFVPPEKVLSPVEYKRIYNRELMKLVDDRKKKLFKGELGVDDLTIKGALAFLRGLKSRGLALYLASGTDEEDARREAEALGYAGLFERIIGANDEVDYDPKRAVMQALLRELEGAGPARFLTFGDGPVEIQECVRSGGYAVGLASDELRRYGLSLRKRSRLILAGADMIAPDFSQHEKLTGLLLEPEADGMRRGAGHV